MADRKEKTDKRIRSCRSDFFIAYSTPKSDAFNVYSDLKAKLIAKGVPPKEIAFIHSYHSEASKIKLFEKVNNGTVRILLGSTFKLGIGANVQTKLKAIHHLDVPWRPADMVQREGRILRRGNLYSEVKIFRYIAEGSFDSYSWQLLETKQRFISQFLSGSEYQRSASDLEENVLTYAQVKALAISQPLMKVLAEKENELRRLQSISSNDTQMRKKRQTAISDKRSLADTLEKRLEATLQNAAYVSSITEADLQNAYAEYKTVLTEEFIRSEASRDEKRMFLDFEIVLPDKERQDPKKPYILLRRNQTEYPIQTGSSAGGNARRIVNFIKKFGELPEKIQARKAECLAEIAQLEQMNLDENPYTQSIAELQEEVLQLRAQINIELPSLDEPDV